MPEFIKTSKSDKNQLMKPIKVTFISDLNLKSCTNMSFKCQYMFHILFFNFVAFVFLCLLGKCQVPIIYQVLYGHPNRKTIQIEELFHF